MKCGKNTKKNWYVLKNKQEIKFHSKLCYEKKYLKAKVREFYCVIKANFLGNDMPNKNMHHTCITCITIDSFMRIDKKNHPEVYLEECKYNVRKIQMSRFINTELKSDVDSDSELHSEKVGGKFDAELMAKWKSDSGSE